ncbi:MAG: molybdopterin molybdotransferase MoeA [Pirellulales bacterium]|nr:molybdopterin molybdotransferase MoeA [Pirellulales bacterium]
MLTVAEAHRAIARCLAPLPPCRLRLGDLVGLRLAEDVAAPVDSPPFDKSVVDGYAIATADGSPVLRELELVTAGRVPTQAVQPGTTIRVMTGAPVPAGADCVVKWEDCELVGDRVIRNPAAHAKAGGCILPRGAAFGAGDVLLTADKQLSPLDIALLAEIGRAEALAVPRPRVAVLPTGDELVEPGQPAGPGQIRNSNGPMLHALLAAVGITSIDLGVGRDDPADLRDKMSRGLRECDVLLVSGGVSAGVKDLVPGILAELGVDEQFHQVRIKPGKPLWFGTLRGRDAFATGEPAADRNGFQSQKNPDPLPASQQHPDASLGPFPPQLVFGLPGNPVSTLVSFRLFVLGALRALAGQPYAPPGVRRATLVNPFTHRGQRPTYHPCRSSPQAGEIAVELLDWKGSADLATLTRADGLAALPAGDYSLAVGDAVDLIDLYQ